MLPIRLTFRRITNIAAQAAIFVAVATIEAASTTQPTLDRTTIRRELQDYSKAGMNRRLGPDYAFYHSNSPAETFPNIWLIPTRQDLIGRPYQLGGPWVLDPGLYSSTQGQLLYAPDAGAFGVDRVHILEWMHGTFSEKPEPPWWGGFRPEPVSVKWLASVRGPLGVPLGMARGLGGWANCGVIIFSSGFVGTAGTHTASGTNPFFQFPTNKVLTAVTITPKSEFALITLTDVKTRQGQLAVLALQNGNWSGFVHDWQGRFPGLPGTAWLSDMKLLGYIDLPSMEFPTGVAASGDDTSRYVFGLDGHVAMLNAWDPAQQATRDSFRTGRNAGFVSTAGYAVVISKHENKAAFIDLQPLFKRVHDLYLTTPENFQKTRNLGPGPAQWPYKFEADPAWTPKLVKIIDVPTPTAVVTSFSRGQRARAYIASIDGTVGGYRLGGLASDAPAVPADIQRVSQTTVGRNPTCLSPQKYVTDKIMAVSRGDREIAWIQDDGTTLRVIRRLRDQRLLDPVHLEMADTHGIEASIITVADFNGRKILNYRFGRVVFELQGGAIFGMGPTGTDEFECGGQLEFPGSPFCVSATNVN
jgi:hypothetical protein